jgi:hypothetical protein
MIRRLYHALPGARAVRVALLIVIAAATIVLLVVFYEWLGVTLLDSGGRIG